MDKATERTDRGLSAILPNRLTKTRPTLKRMAPYKRTKGLIGAVHPTGTPATKPNTRRDAPGRINNKHGYTH